MGKYAATALDEALLEFMLAKKIPTIDDVREFQAKYPEFADDIADTAAETVRYHSSGDALRPFENEPGDEELAWRYIEAFDRSQRLN